MAIYERVRDKKNLQDSIIRGSTILLLSGKIDKHEYLTGE